MIDPMDILNARILIVDDLAPNVRLLEQMLGSAGYKCVTSTMNPHEVCDLHCKHSYDLILLDLMMPGLDGFSILESLKNIESDSYVPALVITAQPGHKLRALQAGAKDFISKPFDLVEVKTRIHNMLEVRLLYKKIASHNKLLEQTVLERTAELRESEERFHRLTELSSDWYWEQDADGGLTKVSGPALEMLGVCGIHAGTKQKGAGEDSGARWNETERAELEANIAERRPFIDFVYSRINNDSSQQYFQMSGEPFFDTVGRYKGYRGIGTDITSRMRSIVPVSALPD